MVFERGESTAVYDKLIESERVEKVKEFVYFGEGWVRCRNGDARERCGLKEDVVTGVERGMLRWFGHLERMSESRPTKQINRANVCDGKVTLENPMETILMAY
ncbi:hypothetical protein EVAR_8093_1 [Eumeta japonica]|uniref:Uncharacterized protein n=1 Tax=Eumeta variegata TaxID=151549 RepID=A0A4C1TSN5_EUMVA|nr:hypothetical protein EVAR_8093_1 [Eumeta japonica]